MNSEDVKNRKFTVLARRYQAELREHLDHGSRLGARQAHELGRRAMDLGLETLDLARIHEQALIKMVLSGYSTSDRDRMVRRGGPFLPRPSHRSRKPIARHGRPTFTWIE